MNALMRPALPGLAAGVRVDAARRAVSRAVAAASHDTPDLDARRLIGHALGRDHAGLAADTARALTSAEADAILALALRRLRREPVARIIGMKEFWSLPLALSPDTLVPRPETETFVEAALDVLRGNRMGALRIADFGTGSGAILLALLHELPKAFGIGTDVSHDALRTARANAARLGLAGRAGFVACDFGAALRGGFDCIVSNPPYIRSMDIAGLEAEVRDFDPRRALDGGPDGFAAYRQIAAQARALLKPNGHLIVELGAGQNEPVAALMAAAGLTVTTARPDLNGVARALVMCPLP